MNTNYQACLNFVLRYEGGFTDNRKDPGNWTGGKVGVGVLKGTKYGVSAGAYPHLDIKNLTLEDVKPIYAKNYWKPVRGDDLPAGVDLVVFDAGVMSGTSRAAKWLQSCVGSTQDGVVGVKTLTKVATANKAAIIKKFCAKRTGFVQSLKTFATFGRGWMSRIAANEALAMKMLLSSNMTSKTSAKDTLNNNAAAANKSAKAQKTGAVVSAAGDGTTIALSDQVAHWLTLGVVVAGVGLVLYLLWRSKVNKTRAAAYVSEANTL